MTTGWRSARKYGEAALPKMKTNPGADGAGLEGDVKKFFGHLLGHSGSAELEGWQQFVVLRQRFARRRQSTTT